MVQVIIFFVAFGILIANGVNVIGAFLGSIAISFIGAFIFLFIGLSSKK